MKLGVGLINDNARDWNRYLEAEANPEATVPPPDVSDYECTQASLHVGRLAEPLGFDSIWCLEHHFTPYTMINNPMQWLAYFAGCTERVGLGTFIYVLPWHHPLRAAEQLITLDHMTNGRELRIGTGRGTAKREYDGLAISMEDTRSLFAESLEVVRKAMANEWFTHEGEHFSFPRTTLRPAPRDRHFFDERLYMAWLSPSSLPYMAELDLLPLILPNQGWDTARDDLVTANGLRTERGLKAGRPITVVFFYCAESDAMAEDQVAESMAHQGNSGSQHYQFGADHWQYLKGYEDNAMRAANIKAREEAGGNSENIRRSGLGVEESATTESVGFLYGSPSTLKEKIEAANKYLAPEELVLIMKFGGMPLPMAETSMRLFAREVLPVVQKFEVQPAPVAATLGA
jgi:alkanesulfonate monooxygenase SsuD/methylene tetrahydromethanopterin reductase-like flavin-dependent oxidoreductase (luciferase family)